MRKIYKRVATVTAIVAASGALIGVGSMNAYAADSNCIASLIQIQRTFGDYDNAAHGGGRDGFISRNDLIAVANGRPANGTHPSPALRNAAAYLVNHPNRLDELDTAAQGGRADGRISMNDISAAITAAGRNQGTCRS